MLAFNRESGLRYRSHARRATYWRLAARLPSNSGSFFGETMVEVRLKEGDRLEWAIKKFRREVQRAGILRDIRRRRFFVKPSEAKRLKAAAARRRRRRQVQRQRRNEF